MIETKDERFINLPISLCLTFNAFIWSLYSLLIHDFFIFIPQSICCLAGVVQLLFFLWITDRLSSQNFLMRFLLLVFDRRSEKLQEVAKNKKQQSAGSQDFCEESTLLSKNIQENASLRSRDTKRDTKDEENNNTLSEQNLSYQQLNLSLNH